MDYDDARLKGRRGAILVVAALSLVTLLMLLAFVVDLGRIIVERSELQVSADAGAHAGAVKLSKGGNTKSAVVNAALQMADTNVVLGQLAVYSDSTVQCGTWDRVNLVFTANTSASACGNNDDAVRVTRAAGELPLFSALMHRTAGNVRTGAVGWVAPTVSGTSCIKPLGVDYKLLIQALNALRAPPSTDLYRPLDNTDFTILRTQSSSLTFCLKDGTTSNQSCPNTALTSGSFGIIGLAPGDGGGNNYTKELGDTCDLPSMQTVISVGDNIDVITGGKVGPTRAGVDTFCNAVSPCVMKFPLYNGTSPVSGPNATDGKACGGGKQGTVVCYGVISIGAGVVDYPALPGTKAGVITGHFTLALDPGAIIGGTTRGLLTKVILVQ